MTKRAITKRAVISLSGGMDSASLLAGILAEKKYDHVHCYGFDYGQRHRVELQNAELLVTHLANHGHPVSYQIINVVDVFSDSQSALGANQAVEVPKDSYSLEVSKQTVVENRNVIFSSIIYGKALAISKLHDCDVDITLGMHANDGATTYLDCRPESVEMSKELYRISNWGSERIDYISPLIHMTKTEVLGAGLEALQVLEIPYSDYYAMTSSCYDPIEYHGVSYSCGLCATCRDRLAAFEAYGLQDPTRYTEDYKKLRKVEEV